MIALYEVRFWEISSLYRPQNVLRLYSILYLPSHIRYLSSQKVYLTRHIRVSIEFIKSYSSFVAYWSLLAMANQWDAFALQTINLILKLFKPKMIIFKAYCRAKIIFPHALINQLLFIVKKSMPNETMNLLICHEIDSHRMRHITADCQFSIVVVYVKYD